MRNIETPGYGDRGGVKNKNTAPIKSPPASQCHIMLASG